MLASIALIGVVKLWSFSYNMTVNTDASGVAYNLARLALEDARKAGHLYGLEGDDVAYYDKGGDLIGRGQDPGSRYRVTTKIISDRFILDSEGNPVVIDGRKQASADSLRNVRATVQILPSYEVVLVKGCHLARSGV